MKTTFSFTFLILMIAFVIGGCSSSVGISKRRYNKGYYVSNIKVPHGSPTNNGVLHKSITSAANDSKEDLTTPAPPPIEQLGAIPLYQKKPFETIQKLIPVTFAKKLNVRKVPSANMFTLTKPSRSENAVGFLASNSANKTSIGNSNDGRSFSLLWIAVVLIVFLWYLGFLAGWGSGGIINLLLILAFILLVLWLLRIL